MITLQVIWFILLFVLLIGYAILDGFDLGVGVIHLFTRDPHERRINLNAIGPVWDGNEVWLLTGGGALFAAFPIVYATVFSSFYMALMLVLFALIFRAVSLEFGNKVDSPKWRGFWSWCFAVGSTLPAILFGVALGNILHGLPLDSEGTFTGSFFGLLNPYSLLVGVLSLFLFTMHGAIYLCLKTDGTQQQRMQKWAGTSWIIVVVLYVITTLATIFTSPFLFEGTLKNPLFYVMFLLMFTGLLYIPVANKAAKHLRTFMASSATIAGMMGLAAVSLFPKLVPALPDLANSLTIENASSTYLTLKTMLIIALIGMPLVIGYTAYMYYAFKGKVVIGEESY